MSHLPVRTKLTTSKPKPRSVSFLLTPPLCLTQKFNTSILELKDATSRRQIDVASFNSRILN